MIITHIKQFAIQHDESMRLLRVEWIGGQSMRHFRDAFRQLQQLAKELSISKALLELDTLPDISAYDQLWLGTNWLPRLQQLPLQQVVVVLGSGQVYNSQAIEMLLTTGRVPFAFDIQMFTQVSPAMHWLTDESPRLPALLAAWHTAYGPALPPMRSTKEPKAAYYWA
ncbi:MAG: hypothetical protein ACRYFV_21040 [Janthinobacterium lividum]|jgi:hypothetical protein